MLDETRNDTNKHPVLSPKLQETHHALMPSNTTITTPYTLQTTDYGLQTTDYRPQTTDYRLQTTTYHLIPTVPRASSSAVVATVASPDCWL